jgi:hypothetical protein
MDVQVSRRHYTMYVSIGALHMIHIGVVYSMVRYSPYVHAQVSREP